MLLAGISSPRAEQFLDQNFGGCRPPSRPSCTALPGPKIDLATKCFSSPLASPAGQYHLGDIVKVDAQNAGIILRIEKVCWGRTGAQVVPSDDLGMEVHSHLFGVLLQPGLSAPSANMCVFRGGEEEPRDPPPQCLFRWGEGETVHRRPRTSSWC